MWKDLIIHKQLYKTFKNIMSDEQIKELLFTMTEYFFYKKDNNVNLKWNVKDITLKKFFNLFVKAHLDIQKDWEKIINEEIKIETILENNNK